ncbi:MAG: hypothetical protein WEB87_06580 [Bacteriovoracaceae bacterium]
MKIEPYSQAENKGDFLKRFSLIPESLYPKRPLPPATYWPWLISQFPGLEVELFIASDSGIEKGRIGCNLSKGHDKTGFFGFFEADLNSQAADELIKAAENWLRNNKVETIIGPIDLNVWMGNRFKTTDNQHVFSWEPNGPSEYVERFTGLGYQLDQDYISNFYDDSVVSFERTKSAYDSALQEGYSFRNLDLSKDGERETLYRLNLKCFPVNYMYEPINFEQYQNIHLKAVENSDMQYSFFIMDPSGAEIGYIFAFIEKDYHIIKTMLIDPKKQGARLASAMVHVTQKQARKNGFIKCVGAMVRKGNVSQHFFDHLQTPEESSEYTLVKKDI